MEPVRRITQFFILNIKNERAKTAKNIFIALFISAIVIIPASFVYRKSLKKSVKVHRRSTLDLNSDTLYNILAFFNRKSLSCLRSVNSHFNQTIQREFASKPYLLFPTLFYSNRECNIYDFGRKRYHVNNRKVVDEILAEKFVYFAITEVFCDDHAILKHFLSMNSNPERTFSLKLSKKFKLSKFHARRLAKCKNFNSIAFHGRVTLLPEFLLGNCLHLWIFDDLFTNSASVPWSKILDFFFRSGGTICLKTKDAPNEAEFLAFSDSVRQRFLAARSPVCFTLSWLTDGPSFEYIENNIENTHTKQRLKQEKYFYGTDSQFYMSAS